MPANENPLVCPLCHARVSYGAIVCRGCQAEVVYGPTKAEISSAGSVGCGCYAMVVALVGGIVLAIWIRLFGYGVLGYLLADFWLLAVCIAGIVGWRKEREKERDRLANGVRFYRLFRRL